MCEIGAATRLALASRRKNLACMLPIVATMKERRSKETLDSCGFLHRLGIRAIAAMLSRAIVAHVANFNTIERATSRKRVDAAHNSLTRFGVFHRVL
jgi:hypothetical protein